MSEIFRKDYHRPLAAYYSPEFVGKKMSLYSVDYVEVGDQNLKSQFFKSPDGGNILIWLNGEGKLLKARAIFWGQVVEWNHWEGLKTGCVIDKKKQKRNAMVRQERVLTQSVKDSIVYDKNPLKLTVSQSIEVIRHISVFDSDIKERILFHFESKRKRSGFLQVFKRLFNRIAFKIKLLF